MDGRLCYSHREASESICLPGKSVLQPFWSAVGYHPAVALIDGKRWQQEIKVHFLCSGTLPGRAGP